MASAPRIVTSSATPKSFSSGCLGCATTEEAKSVRFNLGKCYLNANEPIKSRNAFSILVNQSPENYDLQMDLAAAMYACNQKTEAMGILLELDENSWKLDSKNEKVIKFNLGSHYIRSGDFKKGMEYLSLGREIRVFGTDTHKFPIPKWDGSTQPGKHVLFVGEGGIGDEIINSRFVRNLNNVGMMASIASCHSVHSIFSRMPFEKTQGYTKFTSNIKDIESYDYWTPIMNLPFTMKVDIVDLWDGPYLTADPIYNEKWKNRLTGDFKVGLRWAGNPLYEQDLHRTISLPDIYSALPACWTKYSIQKDNTEILKDFPDITNLESELETFEDALGCINNLDVVITSCTSVAHAAAALGKRVFVMVPIMDYYVWGEGKSTTSWYGDNVTLIRQTKPRNWDSAYAELKAELKKL